MKQRWSSWTFSSMILGWLLLLQTWSIQLKPVEYIKQHLSITSVIQRYSSVNPVNGFCLCPFHEDTSPSMKVNEGPGYYYCFSCGESGNVVKFISKILKISHDQAVEQCLNIIDQTEGFDRYRSENFFIYRCSRII